jgi:hypothetical protein
MGETRKKGKSMFGILVGTLNKAKLEDKQRSASEAAKKRQAIDAKLQAKLAKEQNAVRKQEEAKKDRLNADRTENEIAVKDGIMRHRHNVLPQFSNFLLTSDDIPSPPPSRSPSPTPSKLPSLQPPTGRPPPIYYLPTILTKSQSVFLERRKKQLAVQVDEERSEWETKRKQGLDEVRTMRTKAEEAAATLERRGDKGPGENENETMADGDVKTPSGTHNGDAISEDREDRSAVPMETDDY